MLAIVIFIISSFAFCACLIAIARFFAPKNSASKVKFEDYECGIVSTKIKNTRMPVHFFLTAILFVLFDIEILFMYPFALSFRKFLQTDQAPGIMLSMLLFLILFIFGLWWEIKTKALNWK